MFRGPEGLSNTERLSHETTMTGLEILDKLKALDRNQRLELLPVLISASVYEVLGGECSTLEAGAIMDAFQSGRAALEHQQQSRQWLADQEIRRAEEYLE